MYDTHVPEYMLYSDVIITIFYEHDCIIKMHSTDIGTVVTLYVTKIAGRAWRMCDIQRCSSASSSGSFIICHVIWTVSNESSEEDVIRVILKNQIANRYSAQLNDNYTQYCDSQHSDTIPPCHIPNGNEPNGKFPMNSATQRC